MAATVFVRNLPYDATEEQLAEFFANLGPVRKSIVIKDKGKTTSRGFGFVQFALEEDASRAVAETHGKRWKGRALSVELANERKHFKLRAGATEHVKDEVTVDHIADRDGNGGRATAAERRKRGAASSVDDKPGKRVRSADDARISARGIDPACTVAVGGLVQAGDTGISADQLVTFASTLGTVTNVDFPCPVEHIDGLRQDGCSGEIALVTFAKVHEAQQAVMNLHGRTAIPGSGAFSACLWARQLGGEGAQIHRWRIIVRNIAFCATEALLRKAFSAIGFVWDLHIPKRDDGRKRGFAFVAYTQRVHAEQAIARLNGITLAGRAIAVDWALAKKHYEILTQNDAAHEDDSAHGAGVGDDDVVPEPVDDETARMKEVLSAVMHDHDDTGDHATQQQGSRQRILGVSKGAVGGGNTVVLFAHNLPPEAVARDLQLALRPFTRVLKCRTVRDKVTGRSKGTAFLEFAYDDHAEAALRACSSDSGVVIGGRRVKLARAVSQEQARAMAAGNAAAVTDKRNLLLAREGEVLEDSPAAVGVSASDMAKRKRAAEERTAKLRNPNISVSRTRLHFRNLPAGMDEKELKQLCFAAVAERLSEKPVVRARLLRDQSKLDASGTPRSRGLGFVEMGSHEHALAALRHLNNNPTIFGAHRRPIVEFALEDARAARQHKKKIQDRAERNKQRETPELPSGAPVKTTDRSVGKVRRGRRAG